MLRYLSAFAPALAIIIVAIISITAPRTNSVEAAENPIIVMVTNWGSLPNNGTRWGMSSDPSGTQAQVTTFFVGVPPKVETLTLENAVDTIPRFYPGELTADTPVAFFVKAGNLMVSTQWWPAVCPKGPSFLFGPLGIGLDNTTGSTLSYYEGFTSKGGDLESQHGIQLNGDGVYIGVTTKSALGDALCANAFYKRD